MREGSYRYPRFRISRSVSRRAALWSWCLFGTSGIGCKEGAPDLLHSNQTSSWAKPVSESRPTGHAVAANATTDLATGSPTPAVYPESAAERRTPIVQAGLARSSPTFEHLGYARPAAQVVACGPLGFVRLTEPGFEVYSYQPLRRTARYAHGAFTHVTPQPGYSYILVGAGPSLLYYQANPRSTPLGHLPAIGPFTIWADQQHRERLWVHYLKDDAVHHFALPRDTELAAQLHQSVALPSFDGTLLARLATGQWIYSAHNESGTGVQWRSSTGARTAWLGGLPAQTQAVVPAAGADLWLVLPHAALGYRMSPLDQLLPNGNITLQGEPWVATSEGGRLAMLSQAVSDSKRQWRVQVLATGRLRATLPLTSNATDDIRSAARRALCLAPQRPWVVVAGPSELRVINYATGRELLVDLDAGHP